MRGSRIASLAWCLLLTTNTGATRADHTEDARKVIASGIKALGGQANLLRYKAVMCKGEGTIHVEGRPVACIIRLVFQPPFQHNQVLSGTGFKVTTVLNGDRAWRSTNGIVIELNKEQVREYKQVLFSEQVAGLTPLMTAEGLTLSLLKESTIEGTLCIGVRVRHKNYRDVTLHLDRKTGLLMKMEMVVKDRGSFFAQETFFHDYEIFDGLRRPRRVITTRDRKEYMSWEVTENKALEKKVGDHHFARPSR
jgi:hypothetical protein